MSCAFLNSRLNCGHDHDWTVGDLVIWDTRGLLHRACPYEETSPRELHRSTVAGNEPIQ
ncbi:MAG: TauD/TfdA family dioxygenase [Acidimicrobiales bacterium]